MGEILIVDGAENNWPTHHSRRVFDKMAPEDQKLIRKAAKESVARMREL
jgi:hypothetical protein